MVKHVLQGVVVSNKSSKTLIVKVERTIIHPVYKKTVRKSKKYAVHNEVSAGYDIGDAIIIEECRPVSKTKRWKVVDKK